MLYELSNRKKGVIGFVLFALLAFLIYWLYSVGIKDNGSLKAENEKIKDSISVVKLKNDSLLLEIQERDIDTRLLKDKLDDNQKKYNAIRYNYDKVKKDFKVLPAAIRDSIIREYIRANQ